MDNKKNVDEKMERLERVRSHQMYQNVCEELEKLEETRIYCKHDRKHFMDVARIAYIISLEEKKDLCKEEIYVTALLHDIGRIYEYAEKCSHDSGSVVLALNILPECGFSEEEIKRIAKAIAHHGDYKKAKESELSAVIYRADKLSRECFWCEANATCKWSEEKRNNQIIY